ncbi:MAG: XRE family transcriptional regulator [Clostridiales bacterium]|nr:XRE family transcriptional regulator [Clostridiales bacterium]
MDIGERIKMLRTQQGLTLEEVGTRVGVGKSTVRKWESGQIANMRRDKIALLAKALNVTPTYLMGWKEEAAPARPALPDAIPYTPMPLVRVAGAVRCGPGGLAIEEDLGYERADVPSPKDYIYLRATGDSMAPQICEGDLALVHLQPDVESGELAVVVIDGEEGMLKRVIKREGALILQSFNAAVEPRIVVGEALNDVAIVGKVVQTVRKW